MTATTTTTPTLNDIRSLFSAPVEERPEVTLSALLGQVEELNKNGFINIDVEKLRSEVKTASSDGVDKKFVERTAQKLAYLLRIGRTFASCGTVASEWAPLRRKHSSGYSVLGGDYDAPEYHDLLDAGYTVAIGPDALATLESGWVDTVCSLCGHHPIVWQFPLVSSSKKLILLVGSECIVNYVDAVMPDEYEAKKLAKAIKYSGYVEKKKKKAAKKKIARLLDSPSGWGTTYAETLASEMLPYGVTEKMIETAKRYSEKAGIGRYYTDKNVDTIVRSIEACGFDGTWNREARTVKVRTKLADTVAGTMERAAIMMEKAEEDRWGFFGKAIRYVEHGWDISEKWTHAIEKSLDKAEGKVETTPAPELDDKVEVSGKVYEMEEIYFGAHFSGWKLKIACDNGWTMIVKDHRNEHASNGDRIKVSGTVGWIKVNGRVYVALKGRKKIQKID